VVASERAVLFDFFGTLTHACVRGRGHERVARILGCPLPDLVAVLDASFYPRSRGAFGGPINTLRWIAGQLGLHVSDARLGAAHQARIAALRDDTVIRAEAAPALRLLRSAGYKIAVVSDCGYELPEILPMLPIGRLVDTAIYSVHMGVCKPHPDMYLAAFAALRADPRHSVYVGDGGSRELTGATSFGVNAIRLGAPDLAEHLVFRSDEEFRGPVAMSLTDIATGIVHAGSTASYVEELSGPPVAPLDEFASVPAGVR